MTLRLPAILALLAAAVFAAVYLIFLQGPHEPSVRGSCVDCNVIVIVIDAAREDHFGLYGYPKNTTPNIDRLAEKSIVFDTAISQATWTKPSIASLFTSVYPTRHTANGAMPMGGAVPAGTGLPESFITLAESFKSRGYSTLGVVTNNHISGKAGFGQGFDRYVGCPGDLCVTKTAVNGLDGFKGEKFLMYLHYIAPHAAYKPPVEYRGRFVEPGDEPVNTSIGDFRVYLAMNLTRPQVSYVISQYDAEIFFDDSLLGRLIAKLESTGQMNNTIIVITADHGEDFLDHPGAFGHIGVPHETQVRVPLIMRIPGAEAKASRIRQQVRLIDVMPTLINLTGGTAPTGIDGVNLAPAIDGRELNLEAYSEKRYVLNWTWLIGFRGSGLKCIVNVGLNGSLGRAQAFNLTADPHEDVDRAGVGGLGEYCRDKVGGYIKANHRPGKPAAVKAPKPTQNEAEVLKSLGYVTG